ncbi:MULTISPECIES: DUF6153 family protein [Streptomyces]|uniref:DUF6153 family protein n=1 Tax=Streptomyces griseosporeus TaxID=1910 RepID=A0ABV3KQC9_STRGS|nr:DUF6153 family protein [Streptomyces actuosus]
MNRAEPRDPQPRVRWWRVVGVLGLLAGLFAMHGLAPGGGLAGGHPQGHARHGVVAVSMDDECGHDGHGGGHARHADATCASGAVSGGPVLPALAVDPLAAHQAVEAPRSYAGDAPEGGRAPPSLSELQLLRI